MGKSLPLGGDLRTGDGRGEPDFESEPTSVAELVAELRLEQPWPSVSVSIDCEWAGTWRAAAAAEETLAGEELAPPLDPTTAVALPVADSSSSSLLFDCCLPPPPPPPPVCWALLLLAPR